ncbi:hypothetical protein SAMN02746089_01470 [Caldanaerobius fijiensis DSM 17918]|uniref:Putative regulatory protein SAMN02746089_01470 n=2 Tax=Caldanaerobius TaxID=862261 RepID=A0A1M4ZPH2_9THEO|nr:hypothetical protein SAMN02746089_01470 [Caldanaerobius fijiensis DSM 17918]
MKGGKPGQGKAVNCKTVKFFEPGWVMNCSNIRLINIGFGNIISANKLVAIVSPESAPIKRIIQEARDRGMLIDATYGRRTRAVIITDSDHVILAAVQPETVANRLNSKDFDIDENILEEPEDQEE